MKRGGSRRSRKRGGSKCVSECHKMYNCKSLCTSSISESKDVLGKRIKRANDELMKLIDQVEKLRQDRKREVDNILDDLSKKQGVSETEIKSARALLENMDEPVSKKKEHIRILTSRFTKEKKTRKRRRRGVYIPLSRDGGGFWDTSSDLEDMECERECSKKREKVCEETCDNIDEHISKRDQMYQNLLYDIDRTKLLISALKSAELNI